MQPAWCTEPMARQPPCRVDALGRSVAGAPPASPLRGEQTIVVSDQSTPTAIVTPPGVPVADACTITPALRAWIECLVDNRVEQASRQTGSALAQQGRREASAAVAVAVQQVEQGRRQLEAALRQQGDQLAGLADGHARLAAAVDALRAGGGQDSALALERVVATVEELQRTVGQDAEGLEARLRVQAAAVEELQGRQADDTARHRAGISELQRLQSDSAARLRQELEELAEACTPLAAMRRELGELGAAVQRLEGSLGGWHAEAAEEARRAARARQEDELAWQQDLQGRVGAALQSAACRAEEAERWAEAAAREASAATAARDGLEATLQELAATAQALAKRLDALQSAATKDIGSARRELEELAHLLQQLEERVDAGRRAAEEGRGQAEDVRREARHQCGRLASELERQQAEIAAAVAGREALELRVREGHEDLRRQADRNHSALQGEVEGLRQRFASFVEGELGSLQKRLSAELRAETRALAKSSQSDISALDEQLWLTDQRLGQRIDELVQAAGRGEKAAAMAVAELARQPLLNPLRPDEAKPAPARRSPDSASTRAPPWSPSPDTAAGASASLAASARSGG